LVRRNNLEILFVVSLLVLIPLVSAGVFQDIIFHVNGTKADSNIGVGIQGGHDFNNDGFDDLLVSAGANDTVYLFYGSSAGGFPKNVSSSLIEANVTFEGLAATFFGGFSGSKRTSSAFVGDFNNDTYTDVYIGAPNYDTAGQLQNSGQAYLFFGAATVNRTISYLHANVTFNNTYNDVANRRFGVSRASTEKNYGDFNGDGYDDLIINTDSYNISSLGASTFNQPGIFIFYGRASIEGSLNDYQANVTILLHHSTVSADLNSGVFGDINNDSIDDIALSYQGLAAGGNNGAGRVFIFYGNFSNGEASINRSTEDANLTFNGSVVNAGIDINNYLGDFNNDSIDDFLIGAGGSGSDPSGVNQGGIIYVFFGSHNMQNSLKGINPDGFANLTINGTLASQALGSIDVATSRSVGVGGDVNDDGINDLLIGSSTSNNGGNHTFIFYGANGMSGVRIGYNDTQANLTLNGTSISVIAGEGVTTWDYDNDTVNEIVVGDYLFDAGNTDTGQLLIYELLDTAAPSLVMNGPANVTYGSTNVSLNVSVHDGLGTGSSSGVSSCWYSLNETANVSFTCLANTTFVANDCAQHNVTIYSNDTLNNVNQSSNVVFSIYTSAATCNPTTTTTTSTAGTGGGSGSTVATVKSGEVKAIGRLSAVGTNREMSTGATVSFELLNEEKHTAKVLSVDKEKQEVEVEISSTPQKIKIKVGETVQVDLTGDEKAEIGVTLIEINEKGNALLNFIRYDDRPVVKRGAARKEALEANDDIRNSVGNALGKLADGEVKDAVKATPWWLWLLIVLVIVGAVVWYYINKVRY